MTRVSGHVWRGRHMPSALDILAPNCAPAGNDRSEKTLLIGWEFGGGLGHVERLVPVVSAYLDQGWRVVAAVRDKPFGEYRFAGLRERHGAHRLSIVQAPRFASRRFPDVRPISLAQIFCFMGFNDVGLVGPLVRQWEALLHHVRPDAVLSDYAPALNLAARGRIPIMVIGNGWTIPPAQDVVPPLAQTSADADLPSYEEQVVACAIAVIGKGNAPPRFCDILRGNNNSVCVIPELDPYRDSRTDSYCWSPEFPAPRPIDPADRRGGLVYLPADHPDRAAVTKACAESNIPFRAYFAGDGAGKFGNLTVHVEPLDFVHEIPASKVVIHHGGMGTTMWAIVNGVHQWSFARDFEKSIYSRLAFDNKNSINDNSNPMKYISIQS